MNTKRILEVSNSLKFDANDVVIRQIKELYEELELKINLLKKIDTKNVEPMTRIDNTPITFLREDIVGEHLSKTIILSNAPSSDENFVIINNGGSDD